MSEVFQKLISLEDTMSKIVDISLRRGIVFRTVPTYNYLILFPARDYLLKFFHRTHSLPDGNSFDINYTTHPDYSTTINPLWFICINPFTEKVEYLAYNPDIDLFDFEKLEPKYRLEDIVDIVSRRIVLLEVDLKKLLEEHGKFVIMNWKLFEYLRQDVNLCRPILCEMEITIDAEKINYNLSKYVVNYLYGDELKEFLLRHKDFGKITYVIQFFDKISNIIGLENARKICSRLVKVFIESTYKTLNELS